MTAKDALEKAMAESNVDPRTAGGIYWLLSLRAEIDGHLTTAAKLATIGDDIN